MNIKRRVKDAIHVLLGNKIAIGKETSIYDIVKPSYKEIYSEISIKLQQLSNMALKLSIGFKK